LVTFKTSIACERKPGCYIKTTGGKKDVRGHRSVEFVLSGKAPPEGGSITEKKASNAQWTPTGGELLSWLKERED